MSTFRVSEWAPANETAHDLYVERTNFDGFALGAFGYGAQLVIAFMCFQALWKFRRRQPRMSYCLMVYVGAIFILGTLGNAGNMKLSELAFVGNRDYPGGPNAYLLIQSSFVQVNLMCYAAYIMATWMQDGFLLYRFLVVFNYNWYFFVVPCLVYILSIIMSCFLLAELTETGAELFSAATVNFALAYWACSIATTMSLTCLIVGRLLFFRIRLHRAMGPGHRSPYFTVSAILIESALLYSLFALAFIILFAKNDPFQNVIFPILGQVQIIAPELIILRVAWGKSFMDHTVNNTTTENNLRFRRRPTASSSQVIALQMSKLSGNGSTTLNQSVPDDGKSTGSEAKVGPFESV